jgi:hypothetical protein
MSNIEGFDWLIGGPVPQGFPPLYPQTPEEIDAGVTPANYSYPPGNVLRYGADPLGIADSTISFQSALNSVSFIVSPTTQVQCNAQGGEVCVPRGIYVITSTLYINSNIHIIGEDCGPLQQSHLQTTGFVGSAVIYYKNAIQKSILFDATGFSFTTQSSYTGTASAGSSSGITITSGLTINTLGIVQITITSGTGVGQIRPIAVYNSVTGVTSVSWPWTIPPDNTSTWSIAGLTVGSRMTQLISAQENAILNNGVGSYVQAPGLRNLTLVSTTGHYMGVRMNVAPQCFLENLLIDGFQVSAEVTGCSYGRAQNVISAALLIGFAWVGSDRFLRVQCQDYSVNGSSSPITTANKPWFVEWMATEGIDPNSNYWTAHYFTSGAGTSIGCDGEGGDRSYFVSTPVGESFYGCHMERFNYIGYYQNGGTATWIGGDWYNTNTAPAFSGISCNLTIDGLSPNIGMGATAVTIGSFPNTYGGRVTVRDVIPQGGDSRPSAGSLVSWDAYPLRIAATPFNTVGGATLAAASLYSRAIVRGGTQTSGFSDTTDTAANLIAQFIPPPQANSLGVYITGNTFECTIYNATSQIETLLAGSGVTFIGPLSTAPTIAAGENRIVTVIITNIGTPAVNILG